MRLKLILISMGLSVFVASVAIAFGLRHGVNQISQVFRNSAPGWSRGNRDQTCTAGGNRSRLAARESQAPAGSGYPLRSLDAQLIYGQSPVEFGDAAEIVFPDDPAIVLNVKEFGAAGDGTTDDTDTIQRAIYAATESNQALYFPNGIYRLTRELRFQTAAAKSLIVGPHLYGQSRDKVILKLDDNLPEFANPDKPVKAVIRTVNAEDGTTWRDISADFFNRQIINFTIDAGNNPGAVGIKFYSNNTGLLKNVLIVGNGAVGVDLASIDLNGPNLLQNIEVDGFDVGVHGSGSNSATISNLTVRNASVYGLYHTSGVLQVEGLVVENACVAVFTAPTAPFGQTTLTLVNGQFQGGNLSHAAIISGDVLFARHIITRGYAKALEARSGTAGSVENAFIREYSSHGVSKKRVANVDTSLNLAIRYVPLAYDTNPQNWVSVHHYGAIPGDNVDDTRAIQKAIDRAAAAGKTTIYFPGHASSDPNWYTLDGEVEVHGTVRHLIGFAPARILGDGRFKVIEDASGANTVHIQGFNFTKIGYENASSRTMVLQSLTGSVWLTGPGETYLSSVAGPLSIENPDATVWARQLNTEVAHDQNVFNNGGTLWVLGQKTERGGFKAQTLNGGRTEILGAYIYAVSDGAFDTVYQVVESDASFAGIRERKNTAKYSNFVQEIRDGEDLVFSEHELPAGNHHNRGISLYSATMEALD